MITPTEHLYPHFTDVEIESQRDDSSLPMCKICPWAIFGNTGASSPRLDPTVVTDRAMNQVLFLAMPLSHREAQGGADKDRKLELGHQGPSRGWLAGWLAPLPALDPKWAGGAGHIPG